jgi:hypothetical protein
MVAATLLAQPSALSNFIARALRHFSQIREKSLTWIAKLA